MKRLEYNVYCDESSHLRHSDNKIMTLGYISCPKAYVKPISQHLKNIKQKHGLSSFYELKWTKVSSTKINYYKELIDYFFDNEKLFARIVVANKSNLDYQRYKLSHDDWYYRMYYLLLGKTFLETNKYYIYLDIKDTNSSAKVSRLNEILSKSYYDFAGTMIMNLQQIRSHESEILQLNDLIIGALSYKNNRLSRSPAKLEVVNYLEERSGKSLISSTSRYEEKFNILKWEANFYD